MYASEMIYDDTDIDAIERLAPDAPHRLVDVAVVAADEAGQLLKKNNLLICGSDKTT